MARLSILGFFGFLKTISIDIFKFKKEDQYQVAIARGSLLSLAGLIFITASNFIYQFILARKLTPDDYGLFNLGAAIAFLIGLVVVFGLDRTVVRFVSEFVVNDNRRNELGTVAAVLGFVLITGLLVTPVAWFAGKFISVSIFNKPELTVTLRLFILGLPFYALTRVLMGVLQGYKWIQPYVYIEQILVSILKIGGLFLAFFLIKVSTEVAALSNSSAVIIGTIAAVVIAVNHLWKRFKGNKPANLYREILSYTWPLFLASLLNRTNAYTETLFLGVLSTSTEVGLYTLGYKISVTLIVFYESIHVILAPYFGELYGRGDVKTIGKQYRAVTHWTLLVTLPFALLLLLQAPTIISLFNPSFIDSTPILRVLVISQLAYVVIGPAALTLIMTGNTRLNLIDLILNLILSIFLDLLLIPRFGAIGAAIAGAITIVMVNLLRILQVNYIYHIQPFSKAQLNTIAAGAAAGLLAFSVGWAVKDCTDLVKLAIITLTLFLSYGLSLAAMARIQPDATVD